jgi:hypothetical protein
MAKGLAEAGAQRRSQPIEADRILERDTALQKIHRHWGTQGGFAPERLGEAVHLALSTARPKARYTVIKQRFKNWTFPRLLPTRMLDAIVAKQLGFIKS